MEVILKEDVPKLGSRGDVVKVAEGYGRNYLLPRKLAIEATAANKAVIDQMRQAAQRRAAREKADAEGMAGQFADLTLNFRRKAGEKEHLFGSVTSADIAEALAQRGIDVDKRKLQLTEAIKTVGEHTVVAKLHRDVAVSFKVVVEAEA